MYLFIYFHSLTSLTHLCIYLIIYLLYPEYYFSFALVDVSLRFFGVALTGLRLMNDTLSIFVEFF